MKRVNIAIIGSGPAGISAAINAKIRHQSFYLFGNNKMSEKVRRSHEILNYPGFSAISGKDLLCHYQKHLQSMDISIINETITAIYKMGKYYSLFVNEKEYQARSIIIASGVETIKPYPGELSLLGRGVSYCATCDGHLYKNKRIAVVCDCLDSEHEVDYLANIAEHVYYFPLFQGSQLKRHNVEVVRKSILEIQGENNVEKLLLNDQTLFNIDVVFLLKQSISPQNLLRNLEMNEMHIRVNRYMATNLRGCFAAGDCTGRPYQIAKAIGEGNIALHSAIDYLAEVDHVE